MTTHGIIAPPLRRDDLLGAVLTGGASRRMGSPKCDLVVSGVRVLERLCGLLSARTGGVILAGGRPDPAGLSRDWPCVPDAFPGLGPLGGIATALRHAPGVGVLVVACDMVALGGEVLDHLLAGRNPQAAATVLVNPSSTRVEPMPGLYEARSLPSIEEALRAGRRSILDWLAGAGASSLALPSALAGQLDGANTPEELAALANRPAP